MATEADTAEIVTSLLDIYQPDRFSEGTMRLYVQALADLDITALRDAATEYAKSGKWFPKVAELRDLARKLHKFDYLESVVKAADAEVEAHPGAVYRKANDLFRLWLRNKITEEQYFSDPCVRWVEARRKPETAEQQRTWAQVQRDVAQQMAEDYGADWRTCDEAELARRDAIMQDRQCSEWRGIPVRIPERVR